MGINVEKERQDGFTSLFNSLEEKDIYPSWETELSEWTIFRADGDVAVWLSAEG